MALFNEFRGNQIPEHWKIKDEYKSGKEPQHGDVLGYMEEIYPGYLSAWLVWVVEEDSEIGSIHTMSQMRYHEIFKK